MSEPEAVALARALSAADNADDESFWEQWLPFATVVMAHLPTDYVIITRQEYGSLIRNSSAADPDRGAILEALVTANRRFLADFLDPVARAVAMGQIGSIIRQLSQYDWRRDERDGRG